MATPPRTTLTDSWFVVHTARRGVTGGDVVVVGGIVVVVVVGGIVVVVG
jgi:hypothetical protein